MGFLRRLFSGFCQPNYNCYQQQPQYYYQQPSCQQQYYYQQPSCEQYYYPQQQQQWGNCDGQYYYPQQQEYNNFNGYPDVNTVNPGCNSGCNQSTPQYQGGQLQPIPDSNFSQPQQQGNYGTYPSYNNNNYPVNNVNPNIPDGRNVEAWNQLYRDAGITGAVRDQFIQNDYEPLMQYKNSGQMTTDEFNASIYAAIERYRNNNNQQGPTPADNNNFIPPAPEPANEELPAPLKVPQIQDEPRPELIAPPIPDAPTTNSKSKGISKDIKVA